MTNSDYRIQLKALVDVAYAEFRKIDQTLDEMIASQTPMDTDEFVRLQHRGAIAQARLRALTEAWELLTPADAESPNAEELPQLIAASLFDQHGPEVIDDRVKIMAALAQTGLVDIDHPDAVADREMIDMVCGYIRDIRNG